MAGNKTRRWITLIMVVILTVFFQVMTGNFLEWNNISNLLRSASYVGILSLGVTMTIIAGGNDLSTGSTVGLIATVATRLLYAGLPVPIVILLCILVGLACGFMNGYLITKFQLPDFIATLATLYVISGFTLIFSFHQGGNIVTYGISNADFLKLAGTIGGVNGISYVVIAWILVLLIIMFLLNRTQFGTYLFAIGTNANASKLTGINVKRTKIIAYTLCGCCSAIVGIFLLAFQAAAAPTTGGSYTFNAICASVIGGAALSGGYGDGIGTFFGALFMQVLATGLYKMNIPSEFQTVAVGAFIIIMSMFNTLYIRFTTYRIHMKSIAAMEMLKEKEARKA